MVSHTSKVPRKPSRLTTPKNRVRITTEDREIREYAKIRQNVRSRKSSVVRSACVRRWHGKEGGARVTCGRSRALSGSPRFIGARFSSSHDHPGLTTRQFRQLLCDLFCLLRYNTVIFIPQFANEAKSEVQQSNSRNLRKRKDSLTDIARKIVSRVERHGQQNPQK